MKKELKDLFITEAEASALTGYKRTRLYQFRVSGQVRWTAAKSGRKIRYHKTDLEKLIGL